MELDTLVLKCGCGGKMSKTAVEWRGIKVRGWRCAKCKEDLIHPIDAKKALDMEKAKKRNLLSVKLRKVGKSNVVTVPQPIMEAENLKEGQKLEWKIEAGKLILTQ